jgi:hypothetical protein
VLKMKVCFRCKRVFSWPGLAINVPGVDLSTGHMNMYHPGNRTGMARKTWKEKGTPLKSNRLKKTLFSLIFEICNLFPLNHNLNS